jgi:methyl-accepting chemotaxis protein
VKELARETSQATENIAGVIDTMRCRIEEATAASARIGAVISTVLVGQHAIASPAQEQNSASTRIEAAIDRVLITSREIQQDVTALTAACAESVSRAHEAGAASTALTAMATDLAHAVCVWRLH